LTAERRPLVFCRLLFRQPYLRALQLLLHASYVVALHIGGQGAIPFFQGALPLRCSQLQTACLGIHLAHVVVDRWVFADVLHRSPQVLFSHFVVPNLVVGPAQGIQISAILRLFLYSLFDQTERFLQPHAAVGQHVSEIVQRHRIAWISAEHLAEHLLGRFIFFLPFVVRAAQEVVVLFVLGLVAERIGFVQSLIGIGPAPQTRVNLRQRQVDIAIFRGILQFSRGHRDTLIGLAVVCQLAGQNQAHRSIFRQRL